MKRCSGCDKRCELGCTITMQYIAPRVGDVTYWIYDIYSSGVWRTLFEKYVGDTNNKAQLKLLATRRAKDIARYCEKQR